MVRADTERTVLTGKIVDASGKLVAGARVIGTVDFYDPINRAVAERFPSSGYAMAADGTFVVRQGEQRAGVKTLRFRSIASADGYSTSDEVVSVPIGTPGYAPAVVVLRPAVEQHVLVVDDVTQAPIASALVTADCTPSKEAQPTGADGRVVLRGCDDRRVSLDSFSADRFMLSATDAHGLGVAREIVFKDQHGPITLVVKPTR